MVASELFFNNGKIQVSASNDSFKACRIRCKTYFGAEMNAFVLSWSFNSCGKEKNERYLGKTLNERV